MTWNQYFFQFTFVDPGGTPLVPPPPKGAESFVLTYKCLETELPRELASPPYKVGASPLREILDPPLIYSRFFIHI